MYPEGMPPRSSQVHTESSQPAIVLLGEALVDVFPDRDVLGGAPFNVARNLAALGGRPVMVTRIGSDAFGEQIDAAFQRLMMDRRGLQRDPLRATGTVNVKLHGETHQFEIAPDKAWDHLELDAAVAAVQSSAPCLIYFGTLAQRGHTSRDALRACLAATGATRFLDLNLRDCPDNQSIAADSLALADIVKVNEEELDQCLKWFVDPGHVAVKWDGAKRDVAVAAMMRRFDLARLVVTRGSQGWACIETNEDGWREGRSPPVAVRDTVGAGDAFSSVLLLGEANRWPLAVSLKRASDFASAVCTLRGAVDESAHLYEATMAGWNAAREDHANI